MKIECSAKVIIVYRSYANDPNVSHQGLGICAMNTCKTLNQNGIHCQVWPITSVSQMEEQLSLDPIVTHVVIQAPWIEARNLTRIAHRFSSVQFAVNCHSQVGFLQTEPAALTRMLDIVEAEQATHNIHAAGNSREFVEWIETAYQFPCTHLPNLYFLDKHAESHRPIHDGGLLRIGLFGAPRPQKNVVTGVAGAIEIAQLLKVHTEIWLNQGRNETHGKSILEACKRAIERNPFCTYKEFQWADWPKFRHFMGSMNLIIQASYTESFNQVAADGCAVGVPTVVSPAIRWAPDYWKCDPDDANHIARIGMMLIKSHHAQKDGLRALKRHNEMGVHQWRKYLRESVYE